MSQEFESFEDESEVVQPVATSFGTVTERLSEIAEVMEDETMPLDDALDLLEEAVALGMQASSLLESDMEARNAEEDAEEASTEPAEENGPGLGGATSTEPAEEASAIPSEEASPEPGELTE